MCEPNGKRLIMKRKIYKVEQIKSTMQKLYVDESKSLVEVAQILDIDLSTAYDKISKCEIQLRPHKFQSKIRKLDEERLKNELYRLSLEGKTFAEISKIYKVDPTTMGEWFRRLNVPILTKEECLSIRRKKLFGLTSKELEIKIRKLYLEEGSDAKRIGKILGVDGGTVGRWLLEFKIPKRTLAKRSLKGTTYENLSNEELKKLLERLYWQEEKSTEVIGREWGVFGHIIQQLMSDLGIQRRNLLEHMKVVWKNPKYVKKQKESHEGCWTEGRRKKISETQNKLWETQEHRSKMQRAWRVTPNAFEWLVGSLPEMSNYSFTGDFSKRIGNKCPDFVWEEKKKIIELNGEQWHQDPKREQSKIRLFRKHGYETLVIWWKEWNKGRGSRLIKQKIQRFNNS